MHYRLTSWLAALAYLALFVLFCAGALACWMAVRVTARLRRGSKARLRHAAPPRQGRKL